MAKQKAAEEVQEAPKVNSKEQVKSIVTAKENKEKSEYGKESVKWKISTGSLILDGYVGGGLTPSLLRICGHNNEGKTPMTLEIMRQFLNTVPNSKGFWLLAEGRGLTEENVQRCGLKFVYKAEEWDVGTVFVLESNNFELFISIVKTLVKNNIEKHCYCFVIDSLDGLILSADADKEISDNNMVAGVPRISKKMMQSLSIGMFKYGHLMILISQVTATIDKVVNGRTIKGPPRGGDFSGGNSLLHGADWIFEISHTSRYDYYYDTPDEKWAADANPIGKKVYVTLQKSALEKSRTHDVEYPIKFGRKPCGVWIEREIVQKLMGDNTWEPNVEPLLIIKGTWLSFHPELFKEMQALVPDAKEQIQGEAKMTRYLEQNPQITDLLYKKILNLELSKKKNETTGP